MAYCICAYAKMLREPCCEGLGCTMLLCACRRVQGGNTLSNLLNQPFVKEIAPDARVDMARQVSRALCYTCVLRLLFSGLPMLLPASSSRLTTHCCA